MFLPRKNVLREKMFHSRREDSQQESFSTNVPQQEKISQWKKGFSTVEKSISKKFLIKKTFLTGRKVCQQEKSFSVGGEFLSGRKISQWKSFSQMEKRFSARKIFVIEIKFSQEEKVSQLGKSFSQRNSFSTEVSY